MPATILTVDRVTKRYGAQELFRSLRFQILERDRIGLVGPNGAGKSTLLRLLAGLELPDEGQIVRQNGLRIGYVPQDPVIPPEQTVLDAALAAAADIRALGRQLEQLAVAVSEAADPEEQARLLRLYERLSGRFEAAGGYDLEVRAQQVLAGLGFGDDDFRRPAHYLSGGQRTRLALARALLSDPDLLLLDEPTNHLDMDALAWLEQFLQRWRGALLVVAHDRYFLDQVTTRTLELAFGRIEEYPGNYSHYVELRAQRFAQRLAAYEAQQEYIRKEEAFIQRYRAGQRAREARGRATKLARLERLERPHELERLTFSLVQAGRSGQDVLRTSALAIGYPGRPLFETPELSLRRGERVALIGANGSGKTTFLRTLLGEIPPLRGAIRFGHGVKLGYLPQDPSLPEDRSILELLMRRSAMSEEQARRFAARFSFEDDEVFKPVTVLSGGERRRLALALLTLEHPNVLVLDEPTNHLDLPSREALETVLAEFEGTILFVSHDRYFIDRLATVVWAIEGDRLIVSLGNYTDYRRACQVPPEVVPSPASQSVPERQSAVSVRRSPRQVERELVQLERTIEELEARAQRLLEDLEEAARREDVDTVSQLGASYEEVSRALAEAYARWERLDDELASLRGGG